MSKEEEIGKERDMLSYEELEEKLIQSDKNCVSLRKRIGMMEEDILHLRTLAIDVDVTRRYAMLQIGELADEGSVSDEVFSLVNNLSYRAARLTDEFLDAFKEV